MTFLRYDDAGTGEAVLLLHSSAADSRMWDPQWPALTNRFRVIRPDFRGYGGTPWAAEEPYSDAGDVLALLDELGVEKVAVVGASHGGQVALEVASARPGLVSRLVLLAAPCGLPATPELEAFAAEEERLAEAGDLAGAAELNARTWLGPDAAPETRSFLAEMQHRAYTLQLAADPEPEQREEEIDLDRLTMPALVVCGAHDLGYFRDSARHLAERLPQATLVELEWAGHLPSMERPEETTKLITEFLSR
jgi:Predicted hydrolases or acyltransferases (alpha/beta hydrolase superfamily)